jgi:hypothetical protein
MLYWHLEDEDTRRIYRLLQWHPVYEFTEVSQDLEDLAVSQPGTLFQGCHTDDTFHDTWLTLCHELHGKTMMHKRVNEHASGWTCKKRNRMKARLVLVIVQTTHHQQEKDGRKRMIWLYQNKKSQGKRCYTRTMIHVKPIKLSKWPHTMNHFNKTRAGLRRGKPTMSLLLIDKARAKIEDLSMSVVCVYLELD